MLKTAISRAPGGLVAFVTASALVLSACGGAPPAPTAAPKPTEAPKPTTAAAPAAASPAAAVSSPAAAASAASPSTSASPTASPSPSPAAAIGPTFVGGEVDAVDGRVLSIATSTGVRKVRAADNATVLIEGKGSPEDLKPGTFVAITGKPDGTVVNVRLFSPGISPKPTQFSMGGAQAGNVMTNATIVSFDGKAIVVDLGADKQTMMMAPTSEVIKPVPSTFSEIKPGVRVTALGVPDGDVLTAQTITITTTPNPVRAN